MRRSVTNRRISGGRVPRPRLAALLMLTVLMAACGDHPATTRREASPAVDVADLHVQVLDAFACPSPVTPTGVGDPPDRLVLASPRLDYDAAEVQAMTAFLAQSTYGIVTGPRPPDTLAWIPVARLSEPCGVGLEITNTGQSPVQVTAAGVVMAAGARAGPPEYRLIDACSIAPNPDECPPARGGTPTNCDIYEVNLALGGDAGDAISAPPMPQTADPSCGEMTLPPAGVKDLYMILTSAKPLVYTVAPRLDLATAEGTRTLIIPRLTATLAFAADSQFSCYELHGTSFGFERQGPSVFQDVYTASGAPASWCL
jgi:hypothetical protein